MPASYTYLVDLQTPDGDWQLIEDCIPRLHEAVRMAETAHAETGGTVEVWCKETDTLQWSIVAKPNR